MRVGSLFSGAGGLDMAVKTLWPQADVVAFSEIDPHAAAVFQHHHPDARPLGDITKVDFTQLEQVDVLTAGFPCTDLSTAGHQAGLTEGTRSGLWYEVAEAIEALRPSVVLLENVSEICTADGGTHAVRHPDRWDLEGRDGTAVPVRALGAVLRSLADLRFDAEWGVLTAADVGACHRRSRWFAVAWPAVRHPNQGGSGRQLGTDRSEGTGRTRTSAVPHQPDRRPARPGLMLPTPCARDWKGAPTDPDGRGRTTGQLDEAVEVLLPKMADGWGEYAAAVEHHEQVFGRPAPHPVNERGRLSPYFTEWMMGWPDGYTAVTGASRRQRIMMCGNGVVPQQAAAAYRSLLARAAAS